MSKAGGAGERDGVGYLQYSILTFKEQGFGKGRFFFSGNPETKGACRGNRGQALVELAVAMIAVLVLVAGLLQIVALSRAHLDAIDLARERAGLRALGGLIGAESPPMHYLRNWSAGPDGRPYTRDDVPLRGNPELVRQGILRHARPGSLALRVPGNPLSTAMTDDPLVHHFGLVGVRETSEPVPLLSTVQRMIYRADEITFEPVVWSVRLDGLE